MLSVSQCVCVCVTRTHTRVCTHTRMQTRTHSVSMKLSSLMSSGVGGVAGLPVAGFVWATGYAIHSHVLDSTVSPIFAMYK